MSYGVCSSVGCNEEATMQCPTCLKKGLPTRFFCGQDCFRANWDLHKPFHQGFQIETIEEGDGVNFPKTGNTVRVHYTGTLLNGFEFDSSRSRGEPFEFGLGLRQVIKAWDIGIGMLSLGQRAILTCPPHLAYGAAGAGKSIPPNSTLKFDVELISFN